MFRCGIPIPTDNIITVLRISPYIDTEDFFGKVSTEKNVEMMMIDLECACINFSFSDIDTYNMIYCNTNYEQMLIHRLAHCQLPNGRI